MAQNYISLKPTSSSQRLISPREWFLPFAVTQNCMISMKIGYLPRMNTFGNFSNP
jgi:hypothetical protein